MEFWSKIYKSLIITKYDTGARYVHLCGCVSTYICCACMCTHTCTCGFMLFAHRSTYIFERDLSCTIQSKSKFESSQDSEVFGSKPDFQYIKKWVLFKFKDPFKAQTFLTSNLSQSGNEIWALQMRQGHVKNTGTLCLYQDDIARRHSNEQLGLLLV